MEIFWWVFFGLAVGLIARLLVPGPDPGGVFVTMALGVLGALVGGLLAQVLGIQGAGEPYGFLLSIVGAVLILTIYRWGVRRRTSS
jgi:uncharacterized membrane protein YeaQ/YmgE (transglycosylase-associated protein family)